MTYTVSARTLAEYYYEGGDLVREENAIARMLEGARGHRALQSAYGADMKSEVPLSTEAEAEGLVFRVQGRADGLRGGEEPLIEEIKTVAFDPADMEDWQPVHWAQAEIYAYILYLESGAPVTVVLTYYALTGEKRSFTRVMTGEELEARFRMYLDAYAAFFKLAVRDADTVRASLDEAEFPYASERPGQRRFMAQSYFALKNGRNLMVEAPTGIGKTVSALFPALKALGEGLIDRVFYLTARGTQKAACEEALRLMRSKDTIVRGVVITAREKICPDTSLRCVPEECPYARGYYDRRRAALTEAFGLYDIGEDAVRALAEKHTVCPFELSLDLSETAQVIICDYNYAFDPAVRLKRFFERKNRSALLVDEAHELADRARDMLSAELDTRAISEARREFGKKHGRSAAGYRACTVLRNALIDAYDGNALIEHEELDEAVCAAADAFIESTCARADRDTPLMGQLFLAALRFSRAAGMYDKVHSRVITERHGRDINVCLYRIDPSEHLGKTFSRVGSALLFSATLTPPEHYAACLGVDIAGDDAFLRLPSPFPRENLFSAAIPVDVRYAAREETLPTVTDCIAALAGSRVGNYLACFPSFGYMNAALSLFRERYPDIRVISQRPGFTASERAGYLNEFVEDPDETLVGFCVLGGLFTEGVDLKGTRLIGAAVVSVGQSTPSPRTDALAAFSAGGFDAAYTYPGMTRVTQAAGRVIRSETDRGVVLLIDNRYCTKKYRELLPEHMRPVTVSADKLRDALDSFPRG